MSNNPYSKYVEGRDPIASLAETSARLESLVRGWTPEMFDRSYAPGKWTARQLFIHLAHTEIVFGDRIRFALTTPGYVVTPFDQDDWMKVENMHDAASALAVYLALRRMDIAFFKSLTPEQRAHKLQHPERGQIDVDWIIIALAGHDRHHLPQFEAIASGASV
jgi:hypothetical protein